MLFRSTYATSANRCRSAAKNCREIGMVWRKFRRHANPYTAAAEVQHLAKIDDTPGGLQFMKESLAPRSITSGS